MKNHKTKRDTDTMILQPHEHCHAPARLRSFMIMFQRNPAQKQLIAHADRWKGKKRRKFQV